MSPKVGFKMHFPRLKNNDEIIIKGTLKNNRERISFNFLDHHGKNVVFHFKTMFEIDRVILNTKKDYEWKDEVLHRHDWKFVSEQGVFDFRFHFSEDSIRIYAPRGSLYYEYTIPEDSDLKIWHIEGIEIWDDLDKVKECAFKYFGDGSN